MLWKKVVAVVVCAILAGLVLAGCSIGGVARGGLSGVDVKDTIMGVQGGVSFAILDVIAALCALGAAGSVIAWGFGMPVPPKTTMAFVIVTIGAWTLKLILVKFIWVIVGLFLLSMVLMGCVIAYSHVGWLEKRLKRDLNGNGEIGT